MLKPILTVIYPTGHLSRHARQEFLHRQRHFLHETVNNDDFNYHILVFESFLLAPIIEIHNVPDDSTDSIEKLKLRIQEIIKFSRPEETLMDIRDLDINQFKSE